MIREEEVNGRVLYENGTHSFIWLGTEGKYRKGVIQTMQYLIIDNGRGILLDPGGVHLFSRVVASVSRYISIDKIDAIFFSHQDPDVSSGIALWLGITQAKVYISELWLRFLPHFGIVDSTRVLPIPDRGSKLKVGPSLELTCVPAHFMHSPGQFSLYDPVSRILFSGDIGAAVFEEGEETVFVEDFARHKASISGFHERYMASNAVTRRWCDAVRRLKPDMIAPQHGAVYRGQALADFLDWLSALRCGVDLADQYF